MPMRRTRSSPTSPMHMPMPMHIPMPMRRTRSSPTSPRSSVGWSSRPSRKGASTWGCARRRPAPAPPPRRPSPRPTCTRGAARQVATIEGESVETVGEPEVVFSDPRSSAVSVIYALKVDHGLSWASANRALADALADPLTKTTKLGGTTGFWRQLRSNRIVLALEMPSTHVDRRHRIHRLLRPAVHTSSKPQCVPCHPIDPAAPAAQTPDPRPQTRPAPDVRP